MTKILQGENLQRIDSWHEFGKQLLFHGWQVEERDRLAVPMGGSVIRATAEDVFQIEYLDIPPNDETRFATAKQYLADNLRVDLFPDPFKYDRQEPYVHMLYAHPEEEFPTETGDVVVSAVNVPLRELVSLEILTPEELA